MEKNSSCQHCIFWSGYELGAYGRCFWIQKTNPSIPAYIDRTPANTIYDSGKDCAVFESKKV